MIANPFKQFKMSEEHARRLNQLAAERGVPEEALIEEGLDLLFREQDRLQGRANTIQDDTEELRRLEEEFGAMPELAGEPFCINREEIVSLAGTPVDSVRILHSGEVR